ncbi:ribonuclease E inhibitor RraB [Thioclava sp. GXIMD4216]|uniref:Ribonuclease E inhibitor RraB n=1 Tax=Thioclava litoralis TaxID=3076557 RepID=A0ABZ1E2I1_9RHOB|nr:ribonuclease E inhibitor RraB [Thioclava sp. FTW29]
MKDQKAETFQIFAEIAKMDAVPAEGVVAFQFVMDDDGANWDDLSDAAEALGYGVEFYEAQDDEDEAVAEITTPVITLDAETLWAHEEKLTLLASIHGFAPDGWAFSGR